MAFGYSIGDILAGANLTYQLLRIMVNTQDASSEYIDAMTELQAMQYAFIQIGQMRAHRMMPEATINAASHIVMQSMDTIAAFLARTKEYQKRLSGPGAKGLQSSWYKVGWQLYKSQELRDLRDDLHRRLTSINTLLAASSHSHPTPSILITNSASEYLMDDDRSVSQDGEKSRLSAENRAAGEGFPLTMYQTSASTETVGDTQQPLGDALSLGPVSFRATGSHAIPKTASITKQSKETDESPHSTMWEEQLDEIRSMLGKLTAVKDVSEKIFFKDAVGRKYAFPFKLASRWTMMEILINQAFDHIEGLGPHIEGLGPHVREGHYDLESPDGDLILKQLWDSTVQPDWQITMKMWPREQLAQLQRQQQNQPGQYSQPPTGRRIVDSATAAPSENSISDDGRVNREGWRGSATPEISRSKSNQRNQAEEDDSESVSRNGDNDSDSDAESEGEPSKREARRGLNTVSEDDSAEESNTNWADEMSADEHNHDKVVVLRRPIDNAWTGRSSGSESSNSSVVAYHSSTDPAPRPRKNIRSRRRAGTPKFAMGHRRIKSGGIAATGRGSRPVTNPA